MPAYVSLRRIKVSMLFEKVMDFIYPPRCPVCQEIVWGEKVHRECLKKLEYVEEPLCKKCGKPIFAEEAEYCFDCTKHEKSFAQGRAVWVYNEVVDTSIFEYKYKGKREYAAFFVDEMLKAWGKWIEGISPDMLLPVPLSQKKYKSRGYNQAKLLADGIGHALGIPVPDKLLIRNRNTEPQKSLGPKERYENLSKAFEISGRIDLKDKKILLVDDIYTTGSTVEACSKALLESGARSVSFITLCIGKGY